MTIQSESESEVSESQLDELSESDVDSIVDELIPEQEESEQDEIVDVIGEIADDITLSAQHIYIHG